VIGKQTLWAFAVELKTEKARTNAAKTVKMDFWKSNLRLLRLFVKINFLKFFILDLLNLKICLSTSKTLKKWQISRKQNRFLIFN